MVYWTLEVVPFYRGAKDIAHCWYRSIGSGAHRRSNARKVPNVPPSTGWTRDSRRRASPFPIPAIHSPFTHTHTHTRTFRYVLDSIAETDTFLCMYALGSWRIGSNRYGTSYSRILEEAEAD